MKTIINTRAERATRSLINSFEAHLVYVQLHGGKLVEVRDKLYMCPAEVVLSAYRLIRTEPTSMESSQWASTSFSKGVGCT